MGWYVTIANKKNEHQILMERKYGLGFAILMFDRLQNIPNKVVFEATGTEAKKNIDNVLGYIRENKNPANVQQLERIEEEFVALRNRIRDGETHISDYSEAMCVVENKDFDKMSFIYEMRDKLEDAVYGYSEYSKRGYESEQMMQFFDSLSDEIRVRIVLRENADIVMFCAGVVLNDEDKKKIATYSVNSDDENGEYEARYTERKLFYMLKDCGIKFATAKRGDKSFYIIVTQDELQKWIANKPYVECSYRYSSTYDIKYIVRNTPEELEKFYCYASWKTDVESIVIKGYELKNATDEQISSVIGKTLRRVCYEADEINMKYIG